MNYSVFDILIQFRDTRVRIPKCQRKILPGGNFVFLFHSVSSHKEQIFEIGVYWLIRFLLCLYATINPVYS